MGGRTLGKKRMTRQNHKRGFSLIEAAIVLGVVGLVIGGIWFAAATIYENYRFSKAASDILLIVKNTQNLISVRDSSVIGVASITQTLKDAGVFPQDWVRGAIDTDRFFNPLTNQRGRVYSYHPGYSGHPPLTYQNGAFSIYMYGAVSEAICYKFTNLLSSIAPKLNGNLLRLQTKTMDTHVVRDFTSFPLSQDNIKTACSGGSFDYLVFFSYTRNN